MKEADQFAPLQIASSSSQSAPIKTSSSSKHRPSPYGAPAPRFGQIMPRQASPERIAKSAQLVGASAVEVDVKARL